MSAPRRRIQVPLSEIAPPGPSDDATARRRTRPGAANDGRLYIFTLVIFVLALVAGYRYMPPLPGAGLHKAVFGPRLYGHIQTLWFADVRAGATVAGPASLKKWFNNPNAKERAAFDKTCTQKYGRALDEIGPKRLRLPPFVDFAVERQMAANLASPLMSEIETSSAAGGRTPEAAASNALSLILLLDQLSRNVFRADPAVVYTHYDRLAQALVHHILASQPRLDLVPKYRTAPVYRTWFYMPLMHSEHLEDHALFASLLASMREDVADQGDEAAVKAVDENLDFDKRHAVIIEQFGRYPHRNQVLGRETTEAERKWLDEGGDRFGTA
jgi:uncharacterized protein (DUF924 family)